VDRMGPIFVQVCGMTECLVGTILKSHQHLVSGSESERRLRSAGQPLLGNEVSSFAKMARPATAGRSAKSCAGRRQS
jgi:hypothetical protein